MLLSIDFPASFQPCSLLVPPIVPLLPPFPTNVDWMETPALAHRTYNQIVILGGASREEVRFRTKLHTEGEARGGLRKGPDGGHQAEGAFPCIRHH